MKRFFIVAHRGGKGPYMENTLDAMKNGLKSGADAIEMDVRYDHFRNRFYLEHDFFHWPWKRSNVIEKIIPFLPSKTTFFIDLKTLYWLRKSYAIYFSKVIKKYALSKKAVIMSFNPFVLIHLRKRARYLQIGLLLGNRFWSFLFRKFIYFLLEPQFIMLHQRFLRKKRFLRKMLKFAKRCELKVLVFTANKPYSWQRIQELNLDGVITDYPEKAIAFFREKNKVKTLGT